jgi:hypothetical protein
MDDKEKSDTLKWIKCWEKAGAAMERTRRARLYDVDVEKAIENLNDAFESALLNSPAKLTSGLVELQAWFAKLRP